MLRLSTLGGGGATGREALTWLLPEPLVLISRVGLTETAGSPYITGHTATDRRTHHGLNPGTPRVFHRLSTAPCLSLLSGSFRAAGYLFIKIPTPSRQGLRASNATPNHCTSSSRSTAAHRSEILATETAAGLASLRSLQEPCPVPREEPRHFLASAGGGC